VKTTQASQVEAQFFLADELHPTPAINTITHAVRIKGPLVPRSPGGGRWRASAAGTTSCDLVSRQPMGRSRA